MKVLFAIFLLAISVLPRNWMQEPTTYRQPAQSEAIQSCKSLLESLYIPSSIQGFIKALADQDYLIQQIKEIRSLPQGNEIIHDQINFEYLFDGTTPGLILQSHRLQIELGYTLVGYAGKIYRSYGYSRQIFKKTTINAPVIKLSNSEIDLLDFSRQVYIEFDSSGKPILKQNAVSSLREDYFSRSGHELVLFRGMSLFEYELNVLLRQFASAPQDSLVEKNLLIKFHAQVEEWLSSQNLSDPNYHERFQQWRDLLSQEEITNGELIGKSLQHLSYDMGGIFTTPSYDAALKFAHGRSHRPASDPDLTGVVVEYRVPKEFISTDPNKAYFGLEFQYLEVGFRSRDQQLLLLNSMVAP